MGIKVILEYENWTTLKTTHAFEFSRSISQSKNYLSIPSFYVTIDYGLIRRKSKYTCVFTQHFADDFISKYIFMFFLIRSVDLHFNLKIHAISSSKEDLQIPPSGIWKYDFDIRPLANFLEKIWFFLLFFPNKTYYLKRHVPNPIIFTFLDELKKNWKNIITHEIDSSINEIEYNCSKRCNKDLWGS